MNNEKEDKKLKAVAIRKDENAEMIKWEIGGVIPDLTYGLISEILSFVYKLNEKSKE